MMSGWSMYEHENISWGEFGSNDDHIVLHQGSERVDEYAASGDAHKTLRPAVEKIVKSDGAGLATRKVLRREDTYFCPIKNGSSNMQESSWSHASDNFVPASCNPEFLSCGSALASKCPKCPDGYVNECTVDTSSNIFCSKSPIESTVSLKGSTSWDFPLNDVSPDGTDLDLLDDESKGRENDPMYYDLPDIGNFEDIDRIFKNYDSTFGQGCMGTTDELLWLSSSNNIYGSEVSLKSGIQSSCSELTALNSISGHHDGGIILLSKSEHQMADHCELSSLSYQFYADRLNNDAEDKGASASQDQINIHLLKTENQYSTQERRMKQYADQKLLSSDVFIQNSCSQHIPKKQKHMLESASSSDLQSYKSHTELEYGCTTHEIPFPQATSNMKFETETNPCFSYEVSDNVMNHTMPFSKRFTDQICKPLTMAPVEMDSSIVQENSCMTSVCPDDVTLEAASFRQLQDVTCQLDVRTKLCIRDSLYRLAMSAKQRHGFSNTNNISRMSSEVTKKSAELMDAETVTNPIDRSVAHLLFTGLPAPVPSTL